MKAHENQGYLGRCVLWCKREDALDLADANPDEQAELFELLPVIKRALVEAFAPDWFNWSFLGNGVRHLHAQIVPRYAMARLFMGVTFTDERFGHSWRTDHAFATAPALLDGVIQRIGGFLP